MIPLWEFYTVLGFVLAASVLVNGYLIYKFRNIDKEARTLSAQLGQHKTTLELNTFSNKALTKRLDELFGKPVNGG